MRTRSPTASAAPPRCPARTQPPAQRLPRMTSSFRRPGWRRFCGASLKVPESELDERPNPILEAGLAGDRKRLLVGLAHLVERDALLQAVVAGDEELLDPLASLGFVHVPLFSSSRDGRPRSPPGADLVRARDAGPHALRARHRLRRHGVHAGVAG